MFEELCVKEEFFVLIIIVFQIIFFLRGKKNIEPYSMLDLLHLLRLLPRGGVRQIHDN